MPIYWVAQTAPGVARFTQQQSQNMAAALAAAGWFIAGAIGYWLGDDEPSLPEGVALEYCIAEEEIPLPIYW